MRTALGGSRLGRGFCSEEWPEPVDAEGAEGNGGGDTGGLGLGGGEFLSCIPIASSLRVPESQTPVNRHEVSFSCAQNRFTVMWVIGGYPINTVYSHRLCHIRIVFPNGYRQRANSDRVLEPKHRHGS